MKNRMMDIIDKKRTVVRMPVSELCNLIGVEESTFNKWKEDPDSINLTSLRKIAEILKITDDEMKDIVR